MCLLQRFCQLPFAGVSARSEGWEPSVCLGFESRHQMKTHVTKTKVCLINNNTYSIYKAQNLVRRDYFKRLHADTDTHRHRRIDRQTDTLYAPPHPPHTYTHTHIQTRTTRARAHTHTHVRTRVYTQRHTHRHTRTHPPPHTHTATTRAR